LVWRIHLLSQPTYHYAGAVIPSGQTNLFGSRLSKTMAQEPMGGGGKDTNRHMTARKRQTPNEKLSENRAVRSLSPGFLGSPALANMTEEDIEDAIQTYISSRNSRKKRIVSRSKTLEQRKAALVTQPQNTEEERKPRDSLFTRDQEALKEAQSSVLSGPRTPMPNDCKIKIKAKPLRLESLEKQIYQTSPRHRML
jgi:hypothetical protein